MPCTALILRVCKAPYVLGTYRTESLFRKGTNLNSVCASPRIINLNVNKKMLAHTGANQQRTKKELNSSLLGYFAKENQFLFHLAHHTVLATPSDKCYIMYPANFGLGVPHLTPQRDGADDFM